MLKFFFWALLALNGVLFAYGQGYLGKFKGDEREPARMKNQLATDKLTLVAAPQAQADAGPAAPEAAAAPGAPVATTPAAAALIACTEVGTFSSAEARRFDTRLARLDLGERLTRIGVPGQDVTSYLVYLPSQGSKEGADRKTAELRGQGVTNSFVLSSGESQFKWGISLGVFKTEAGAQSLLAALGKQGVQGARVAPRGPQTTRQVYRFRDIDAATRARIGGYAQSFDAVEVKSCR